MRWSGRRLKSFWIICLNNCSILVIVLAGAFIACGFFNFSIPISEAATVIDIVEPGGGGVSTPTIVNEDITVNTTWTKASSPYIVNNNITIAKDAILTIEQGVAIKFSGQVDVAIMVLGKIMANGTINEPIYFTSSFDDSVGGSTDNDFENCYFENYDENGIPIGEEICNIIDLDQDTAGDWRGIYFNDSRGSILKNIFFQYGDDTLSFESSEVTFENLNISNSLIGMFGDEESNIKIIGGHIYNIAGDAITFFDNSELILDGVKIENVENGLIGYISNSYKDTYPDKQMFENANITINNSDIGCLGDGITIFNNYSLKISNSNISCLEDGVTLFNEVTAEIDKVKITGASGAGITSFNITKPDMIKVTGSEISNNRYGFMIFDSTFSAHQNYIHNNMGVDVLNGTVDFSSNYWGDPTGPTHRLNSTGVGQVISDNITFMPFLTTNPLIPKNGLSNVMFIPGFEGSRLYRLVGNIETGDFYEKKIWEPALFGSINDIYMNESGESIEEIYTRDIVDQAQVNGVGVKKIYKSFSDEMNNLVTKDQIAAWKAIPYDWRYLPSDIVERGVLNQYGDISYTHDLTDNQVPYIIKQLEELVASSKSGKVTIVTHSNGGLVAKALIQKLKLMKEIGESNLIDKIDNLIIVAAPQLGTAKAIPGLLHGYDQGLGFDLVLSRSKARDFGQNLPGAYGLIPSQKYTEEIEDDLILFGVSLDKVNNWRKTYGNSINSYSEFRNFLLDNHGLRPEADYSDLRNPVQLNENILNRAENLHLGIDNILIPDNIKVHQLAGWGLPTPYDLRYQSGYKCEVFDKYFCNKKRFVLTSDIGITYRGDEIVVGESALYGEGDNYYLNLNQYNENENDGNDHVSIFETPYVIDFINNILFGNNSVLPEYITNDDPGSYDFTTIKMHSPVAIDIYNEEGLHTGVIENEDPNQNIINENIPNSIYMEIGEDKYIVVPKEGNYNLKLEGLGDGIFTLSQEQLVNDVPGESVSFVDIPVTKSLRGEANIVSGELIAYIYIDQESDGVFELKILPSTSSESEPDNDTIEKLIKKKKGNIRLSSNIQNITLNELNLFDVPGKIQTVESSSAVEDITSKVVSDIPSNPKLVVADEDPEENKFTSESEKKLNLNTETKDTDSNSVRIKWQIVIISSVVVLLLSLKFIFKLI